MCKNFYEKISKMAKLKWIIFLGVLFIISYLIILNKPFGVEQLKEITGGLGMLEQQKYYTPEYAYDFFDRQTDVGRAFYKQVIISLDFVFPLIYSVFFMSVILLLTKKMSINNKFLKKLYIIPILTGLLDYVENGLILSMINMYPKRLYNIAFISGIATGLKQFFFSLSLVIILLGLIALLINFIKKKKNVENVK